MAHQFPEYENETKIAFRYAALVKTFDPLTAVKAALDSETYNPSKAAVILARLHEKCVGPVKGPWEMRESRRHKTLIAMLDAMHPFGALHADDIIQEFIFSLDGRATVPLAFKALQDRVLDTVDPVRGTELLHPTLEPGIIAEMERLAGSYAAKPRVSFADLSTEGKLAKRAQHIETGHPVPSGWVQWIVSEFMDNYTWPTAPGNVSAPFADVDDMGKIEKLAAGMEEASVPGPWVSWLIDTHVNPQASSTPSPR